MKIHWCYKGDGDSYHVMLDGESIFQTKDKYKRDMFIAELKVRCNNGTSDLDALCKQQHEALKPFINLAQTVLDPQYTDFKGNKTLYAFDTAEIDYNNLRETLKALEAYNKLFEK